MFVDFAKAYDNVKRNILFAILKRLGCGMLMMTAIISMYTVTNSILGTALISACVGVRQGSPTSCLLFVLCVNDMISLIKNNCGIDDFLQWLHVLVLMDDTVLLSTTRVGIVRKFTLLRNFCDSHGMEINAKKTKFMVLHGSEEDRRPITVNDVSVVLCEQYVYLGSTITADGSTSTTIKAHAQRVMCQALKFIAFVDKNNDVPFWVKKKVFNSALMSSIVYGCESWLNGDLKPVNKLYMWCIKKMLGVRKTTRNDLCLLEIGCPPLHALV